MLLSLLGYFWIHRIEGRQVPSRRHAAAPAANPQKLFMAGEAALRENKLDEAERNFRAVLAVDPDVAGAYANLGVIHMRRKQWPQALAMLHKAEKLAPTVAGIRLNIGLIYFRQNDFGSAIKPFESVVQQAPDSYQARYLLGLCYFFNDRWADTVVDPGAAVGSGFRPIELSLRARTRGGEGEQFGTRTKRRETSWWRWGSDKPEYRLIVGKGHYNRGEYDDAVRELEAAAQADPKLPFVHFNLGLAYVKQAGL